MPFSRQDIERIETLASQIKAERDGPVQDTLDNLREINHELESAWDGPSQVAFETSYGDWIVQLERFRNTLNNVHQFLVSVATNFRDLDETAAEAAQGAAPPQ